MDRQRVRRTIDGSGRDKVCSIVISMSLTDAW